MLPQAKRLEQVYPIERQEPSPPFVTWSGLNVAYTRFGHLKHLAQNGIRHCEQTHCFSLVERIPEKKRKKRKNTLPPINQLCSVGFPFRFQQLEDTFRGYHFNQPLLFVD